jgi:sucrose-6-phosphate hydrolase SacC (GH32 family)
MSTELRVHYWRVLVLPQGILEDTYVFYTSDNVRGWKRATHVTQAVCVARVL